MDEKIKMIIRSYWDKKVTKEQLITSIREVLENEQLTFSDFFNHLIISQNVDDLAYGLEILYAVEKDNEMIDFIHKLLLEPWHRGYEELAHDLQRRERPESIPYLKEAMKKNTNI
jgi:hypothetical protein